MAKVVFILFGVFVAIFAVGHPFLGIMITMLIAMVGTGTAFYFFPVLAGIGWAGPILAFFLWARSLMELFRRGLYSTPPVFWLMFSFLLVSVISITNNIGYPQEIITESKNYFQYWGIAFATHSLVKQEKQMHKIIFVLFLIALLQIPVSLYQQIFIVSHQFRTAPGDSIVGTFGGNPEGGGSSGAQTIFLITIIGAMTAAYLKGKMSITKFVLLTSVMIIPILLNETKIVFFLVPIIAAFIVWVFFKYKFFKTSIIVLILLGAGTVIGLYYFSYLQHGRTDERAESIDIYMDRILTKSIEKERVANRGLARLGSLLYWVSEVKISRDPIKFLFGHGIGSTKNSGMVVGHLNLARKYAGKGIGTTGTSKLLWETGLFGTILFFLFWTVALFQAISRIKRLHRNVLDTKKTIALFGGGVSVLMVLATMFYDTYLFRTAAFNFFSYLSLGVILFCINDPKLQKSVSGRG